MALQEDIVRVSGHRLEGSAAGAAAMAVLVLALGATRTEMGAKLLDLLLPVVSAQEPPKNAADTKPKDPAPKPGEPPKNPEDKAEKEGVPKFPPVLSWREKVKFEEGQDEDTINFTRTDDGKKTKVEFEGYVKEDKPVFELPQRLPVDTSKKEKAALTALVAKALVSFFQKGSVENITSALEKGKISMTVEPKTIDWEVLAEQKEDITPSLTMTRRARFIRDGETTIVIVHDIEGGDVVRVKDELPANIDPSHLGDKA